VRAEVVHAARFPAVHRRLVQVERLLGATHRVRVRELPAAPEGPVGQGLGPGRGEGPQGVGDGDRVLAAVVHRFGGGAGGLAEQDARQDVGVGVFRHAGLVCDDDPAYPGQLPPGGDQRARLQEGLTRHHPAQDRRHPRFGGEGRQGRDRQRPPLGG
ncbi:unnamed protein product, partial [Ectocarpus fasciculatus]